MSILIGSSRLKHNSNPTGSHYPRPSTSRWLTVLSGYLLAMVALPALFSATAAADSETTPPAIVYPGQVVPKEVPLVLAPGLISSDAVESSGTFSPDGREFYFTRRGGSLRYNTIMVTRYTDSGWTEPQRASFSSDHNELQPHFTPDGSKLFYLSHRPMPDRKRSGGAIWFVERIAGAWGSPQPLGSPVNDQMVMYITATLSGTLYFSGQQGILRSEYVNGSYTPPERLGPAINHIPMAAHPYIAPDESYLVFDATAPGRQPNVEMYVSFRNPEGTWSPAKRLGSAINTGDTEMCPSVSPDGKYLFFCRMIKGQGDIYWVETSVLDSFRPTESARPKRERAR